jgi:acyl-CoA synthetase (AMP-forming)/AMP-acid ligase II
MSENLCLTLTTSASDQPTKAALSCRGPTVTYHQLDELTAHFARVLLDRGLNPGVVHLRTAGA